MRTIRRGVGLCIVSMGLAITARSCDDALAQPQPQPPQAQAPAQPTAMPPVPPSPAPVSGDVALGRAIAQQGVPDKGIAACASCHGQNGEGNAQAAFPRLAAQWAPYLQAQLVAYADGRRPNPVMTPIAKQLDDTQRAATAAYYASIDAPSRARSVPASAPGTTSDPGAGQSRRSRPGAAAAGRGDLATTLEQRGDNARRLQSCSNCHGPEGIGESPAYPYLAGQHEAYLVAALNGWRDGSRDSDPSGQMQWIGKQLKDDEIAALARRYAVRPAPDRARSAPKELIAETKDAPTKAGAARGPAATGVEQGTGTGGGSQSNVGGGGGSGGSGKQGSTTR